MMALSVITISGLNGTTKRSTYDSARNKVFSFHGLRKLEDLRKINKLKILKKNVILILLIVIIIKVNVLNCDNRPPGGYPHPSGSGWNVSN